MEDRYLFKAKRTDNEEWVTGSLITCEDGTCKIATRYLDDSANIAILICVYDVDRDTICQCTGIPDKNSKVAYEHDIIETPVGNAKIIWNRSPSPTDKHINVGFEVVFLDATANDSYRHDLGYWIGKSNIIGNIFDNPELLESEG